MFKENLEDTNIDLKVGVTICNDCVIKLYREDYIDDGD
jgi:hypothetical protein